MHRIFALLVTLALLLPAVPAALHAAHPHYLRLLRQGTLALEQGDSAEAVKDLRLACFGLLDEPPLLAECLVHLGLAQAEEGNAAGFQDTFGRLLEVDERFDAYRAAELPAATRSAFEEQAMDKVPPRVLQRSSTFAHLLELEDAGEPSGEEAGPGDGGAPAEAGGGGEPAPGPQLPEATGAAGTPPRAAPLGPAERAKLDRARELLAQARRRGALDEPFRLAREVADAHPESREAQHLAAVIAYRAERWKDAVRYFRRGGDPGDAQAETLFYLAVSLYETGAHEQAASALRRSLPHIQSTPFVRSYREKILGDGSNPPPEGNP